MQTNTCTCTILLFTFRDLLALGLGSITRRRRAGHHHHHHHHHHPGGLSSEFRGGPFENDPMHCQIDLATIHLVHTL